MTCNIFPHGLKRITARLVRRPETGALAILHGALAQDAAGLAAVLHRLRGLDRLGLTRRLRGPIGLDRLGLTRSRFHHGSVKRT